MKLPAFAKVNLHLRVVGKRSDGFHDIETLMVPVTLADEVTVTTSEGDSIEVTCDDPAVPAGEENLATRAAREFSRQTGREFAARIAIGKRIPLGAGLGGGSSNAAAVLLALDSIFQTNLGTEKLQQMAEPLGSDVPFFICRQSAWCRGRGEIITPFAMPENLPLLLIKPPFGVETPWAYKSWSDSRELPGDFEHEQDLGWVKAFNSLERPVFEKFLILPVMKQWLREQPEVRVAAMSGSGSTMLAVLKSEASGEALSARAKESFGPSLWTASCETLE